MWGHGRVRGHRCCPQPSRWDSRRRGCHRQCGAVSGNEPDGAGTVLQSDSQYSQYLYRTFVGATLTIILFIIIITYFIYQFIQIFNKSSFSIISNEFQNPKESIDFTNVPILFGLTDDVGNPLQLDPKVAKYFVILNEYRQQIDKKGNSNTQHIQTILQTERCDKLKDSLDLSLFHGYNISYFQCIKPSQNITINGSYGNISGYKSLKINIKKCNNENDNCLNTNNIDSIISNSKFMVIYRGYKTNFYDLDTKDIEQTIYSRSITLSPYFLKRVFYYCKSRSHPRPIVASPKFDVRLTKDILVEKNFYRKPFIFI